MNETHEQRPHARLSCRHYGVIGWQCPKIPSANNNNNHYYSTTRNLMLISILPILLPCAAAAALQWPFGSPSAPESSGAGDRVNVTLYVMSRCPDAVSCHPSREINTLTHQRLCENVFDQVVNTKGIADKINLDVGYIGTLNSSETLGVSCKHGELECIGNAHQLCLLEHLPLSTFYANIACQNYQDFPGKIGTLGLTKQCAQASKVDWEGSGVGRCVEGKTKRVGDGHEEGGESVEVLGKEARRLLKKSVKRTAKRGVSTSCTVVVKSTLVKGGERRCVVDGGVWKGCDVSSTRLLATPSGCY